MLKSIIHQGLGTSKLSVVLRILGVASKVDEKGVALKVGQKATSYLTPLHAPDIHTFSLDISLTPLLLQSKSLFIFYYKYCL